MVVCDSNDGTLKRVSDAAFSSEEMIMGKAKKEAVSVVGRWKDRDILKRLEWTYNYERQKKLYGSCSGDDDQNDELDVSNLIYDEVKPDQSRASWKLESDSDAAA
ncbi:hypothetical protein HanRHA438_Chr13g0610711 [Helianthus annuus]|uniref:Uncharacterized protein n=1 Tax=Helianthus annuus TaxID=4232 RepID=A0A9K3EJF5_HELAN|nr:hypothetical protein HanXRQr2_Chr13g0600061 [Helianthus annuus]KAJ0477760.1 hypothetical protein HanHA300_Chr13g0492291 [Helianthus annuus]KAJ0482336.1 hypothetical protein HanIR_Chr13g0652781 [Helianthus annuus]KAJ0498592.1 hypothetical protein HanHA89_Chr13g0524411 [Helianthus annuus]KAJ0664606.1 hypothetical protein HanLR1_Chr13g0494411 [Helianthus annuus]